MGKLTLRDLDVTGKRVLMRVDFNVPQDAQGAIVDDSRIRATLPSIQYVLEHGASLVLMSHLGRPKKPDPALSLAPCAKRLSELLNLETAVGDDKVMQGFESEDCVNLPSPTAVSRLKRPVVMAPDCIGPKVEEMASHLQPGQVLMLENLRFHSAEEKPDKDPAFAKNLARLGDCYVNDAFGTAHRAHASTALIAQFFPHKAAAGFLMEKEIEQLGSLLHNPKKPFAALLGGKKVSTKFGVIENLLKRVDVLFLGGAMAFTFLQAQGKKIGASLYEESEVPKAREILTSCSSLRLPVDLVVADSFSNEAHTKIVSVEDGIDEGWQGMDVGPETVRAWSQELSLAATVFWNGPLGVFEMPRFAEGTREIAKILSQLQAHVVVGGGDSVAAVTQMGFGQKFSHLSTGGGASLEFLEYEGHLPGVDALSDRLQHQ